MEPQRSPDRAGTDRLDLLMKLKGKTRLSLDFWDEATAHLDDKALTKLVDNALKSPS